jgi:hypothetical protein
MNCWPTKPSYSRSTALTYEIDLTAEHASQFAGNIGPYIQAGRGTLRPHRARCGQADRARRGDSAGRPLALR